MSTNVTFNGSSYTVPALADASWGTNVSNYLIAIATGCLQKTGGTFTLTAEVNFGATYGIKAAYLKSSTTNIASTGYLSLAKTDTIKWRNNANSADLALAINASDLVTFGGVALVDLSTAQTLTNKTLTSPVLTTPSLGVATATSITATTFTGALVGNASTATSATTATTAGNVSGTVAIGNGGTGQTTAAAALKALAAYSAKGDFVGYDGSAVGRLAVGADGTVLTADAASTYGVKWGTSFTNPMSTTGDMVYGGVSGASTKLATGTTTGLLHGGNGAVPSWSLLVDADVSASAGIAGSKLVAAASGVAGALSTGAQNITGAKTFETQLIGKGTTTNDSAAAGYIGEYKESGASTFASVGTSAQYWDAGSITLSAGDWDVYGSIHWKRNSATTATPDFEIGISGSTGNSSTGLATGINYLYDIAADASTWTFKQNTIGPLRVQSDGTNLYINGTTFSGTQVCYLKAVITYSAGTPQYCYLIRARRVR